MNFGGDLDLLAAGAAARAETIRACEPRGEPTETPRPSELVEDVAEAPAPLAAADPSAAQWRTTLQVAIRFHDTPATLAEELWSGLRGRLWARLTRADGRRFRQFHEFCEAPQPHGLGTPHAVVNRLLLEIGNAREVKLLTVDPSCQGRRDAAPTSRHNGGTSSGRTTQRLRAIAERTPPAVQRLYADGLIGQADAERMGRNRLPPERQARMASFVDRVAAPLAARLQAGWAPLPDERRELRRALKGEIRQVLALEPAKALAAAEALEPDPPSEVLEPPAETTLLTLRPVDAPGAPPAPLTAARVSELPLADLVRAYCLVVRELFGTRLAALREERWIRYELQPAVLCAMTGEDDRALQQTIARIELALRSAAQRNAPAREPTRKAALAPAPLARASARVPAPLARASATREPAAAKDVARSSS